MHQTPKERYQCDLQKAGFNADAAQAIAVDKLQSLYDALIQAQAKKGIKYWCQKLKLCPSPPPVRGLYLWGGVGRGKTYLMDCFYESLPFQQKMRAHFHRFMKQVHGELAQMQTAKDPLKLIAARLSSQVRVICFDEFFVSDITDAMILAGLFDALFLHGVSLVATSNITPDGLYKDGLQRARFLPAIALIKQHTEIINVDGGTDYRLRQLEQAPLYYCPLTQNTDEQLYQQFLTLVPDEETITKGEKITIENRSLTSRYLGEDVIWFEFSELCDGPRSPSDYIEIAKEFHAVLLSNVPILTDQTNDQARRFIHLIDEFYDRNVKLIISAQAPLDALYSGTQLRFEFERTASRLLEMQSHHYLAQAHRP